MKFLDIFAGIGGFRLGLEMAGHECVGHIEWEKFARASYKAMHRPKESEYDGKDIRATRASELPRADIWTFGFPCQDISVAEQKTGFRGNRSSLFFAVTKLVRELEEENKPSILFIENVKNLFSVNGGFDFAKLLIELDEIGYDAEWQLLNSKHFGIPQNRERVFIIGHLRGRGGREIFPIIRENGEIINQIGDPVTIEQIAIPVLTPDRLEKRQNGRRFKEDGEPMFTLTGQDRHGVMIREATKLGHDGLRIRKLTPRECFRLQGFPDDYYERAAKVNSDSQLYKQAGNSVTVNVIYEIAKKF